MLSYKTIWNTFLHVCPELELIPDLLYNPTKSHTFTLNTRTEIVQLFHLCCHDCLAQWFSENRPSSQQTYWLVKVELHNTWSIHKCNKKSESVVDKKVQSCLKMGQFCQKVLHLFTSSLCWLWVTALSDTVHRCPWRWMINDDIKVQGVLFDLVESQRENCYWIRTSCKKVMENDQEFERTVSILLFSISLFPPRRLVAMLGFPLMQYHLRSAQLSGYVCIVSFLPEVFFIKIKLSWSNYFLRIPANTNHLYVIPQFTFFNLL